MSGYNPADGHDVQLAGEAWAAVDGHDIKLRYQPPVAVCGVADTLCDPAPTKTVLADAGATLLLLKEAVADTRAFMNLWAEQAIGQARADLSSSREWTVADDSADLSTLKEKASDALARLNRAIELQHDLLVDAVLSREAAADARAFSRLSAEHDISDLFAGLLASKEFDLADYQAALLRETQLAGDLQAAGRSFKDVHVNLRAFTRYAVERAISDVLGSLRQWIEERTANLTGDLAKAVERLSDVLGSLSTEIEAVADTIERFPWLQQHDVADFRAGLRTAIDLRHDVLVVGISLVEEAVSDMLARTDFYQDQVASADLIVDVAEAVLALSDVSVDSMRLIDRAVDMIARLPKEQTFPTDFRGELMLFRPRQVHLPTVGQNGHAVTLYAQKDRVTGEPVIGADGKDVKLKARTAWTGIELGWYTDLWADFGIPPSAWWKMASAQLRAQLPWRIVDIGVGDLRAILARRIGVAADFAEALSWQKIAPADFIGKLGIKLTDEQWQAVRKKVEVLTRTSLVESSTREVVLDILTSLAIIEIARREVETEILTREVK